MSHQRGTGQQPPPTDPWSHGLGEAEGEEHGQLARDHQSGVQKPGVLSYAEITDHLRDGRVARTQEPINGDHQHSEGATNGPAPQEELYQAAPMRSRAFGR
jgi:hypothetical protein